MGSWFVKGSQDTPGGDPYLRLQTSIDGKPIPIVYGANRIPANVIWVPGNILEVFPPSSQSQGGKGTFGTGTNTSSQGYTYASSVIFALGEGPQNNFIYGWWNKSKGSLVSMHQGGNSQGVDGQFGLTPVFGDYTQGTQIDGYNHRGIALIYSNPMFLGSQTEFPMFTFLAVSTISGIGGGSPSMGGRYGANPKDVIVDFLTNSHYGVIGPQFSPFLDTMASFSGMCVCNGWAISPYIAEQRPASDYLTEWMKGLNSEFIWSSGLLKAIPYTDQNLAANGGTYTAPGPAADSVGPYLITDNDYVPDKGTSVGGVSQPLHIQRKRLEDVDNWIQVQYIDGENGSHEYNTATVDAKDEAHINVFGPKTKPAFTLGMFTENAAAYLSAQAMLGREQILNTYTFTVPSYFILLDPMDIVSITDNNLGIQSLPIRIKEITENDDYSLTIIAEDYLLGTANSPAFNAQGKFGAAPNYNIDPGGIAPPFFFEPTDELAGALEVWGAVTGADLTVWGGADVWTSADGVSYVFAGRITGPARMGTANGLGDVLPAIAGPTIDNLSILGVDLTISQGQLSSITNTDLLNNSNLLYYDGELLSFQNATPTGTYTYNLNILSRYLYGTPESGHGTGSFARIDNGIFKIPYTQDRIGSTIYVKFLSYNQFGGGQHGLADVGAYTYTIKGTALTSPLPDVQNFTSSYVGNITYLDWDPVSDFRPVQYEIRKGVSWVGGTFFGVFAHPHVPAVGDDQYWISARTQPVAGLIVYSQDPVALNATNTITPINLLASFDEGPSGAVWPGTLSGNVVNKGTFIQTIPETAASANLSPATAQLTLARNAPHVTPAHLFIPSATLSLQANVPTGNRFSRRFTPASAALSLVSGIPPIIFDAFFSSGEGWYTIPVTHIVNNGRLAPLLVYIIFAAAGEGSTDFFNPGPPNNNDFFAHSDVFDTYADLETNIYPEIQISSDGLNFGPWQRYQPGFVNAWKLNARMHLISLNPANVSATLTRFQFIVYAETRTDHPLVAELVPSGGTGVVFAPDGGLATPFTGGPNGGEINPNPGVILPAPSLPSVQAHIVNTTANPASPGDYVDISNLTLSGLTIQPKTSAGVGVTRAVTLQVWGF